MITTLEELDIERKKNKRLCKKLEEDDDKFEDLCIQIKKFKKIEEDLRLQVNNNVKVCTTPDKELECLKM